MGSNASTTRGSKSGSDYTQALLDGARASGSGAVRASGSGVPPVVPAGGNEMGLSTAEVLRLREEFGYNEVKEKSVPAWKKFALNFWGPMPFLIELATIVSLVLRDWKDFAFLFALLLINGIVAFVEEFKAGNAIDALKNSLAPTARVLRDGAWTVLDAKELVPNDVVMMRLGDIVPADAKLCAGEPMEIDQSALTGESLPVTKYEGETVFQGSAIKRGELKAIVTHTGENSFFGKAAMLVDSVEKVGNFQKVLWNVAKILVAMATVLVRPFTNSTGSSTPGSMPTGVSVRSKLFKIQASTLFTTGFARAPCTCVANSLMKSSSRFRAGTRRQCFTPASSATSRYSISSSSRVSMCSLTKDIGTTTTLSQPRSPISVSFVSV